LEAHDGFPARRVWSGRAHSAAVTARSVLRLTALGRATYKLAGMVSTKAGGTAAP
jgi:hypothetical protein